MDDAVRSYIDAIAPEHRALFDRLDRLVFRLHPGADLVLSYKMPTYRVGKRRLHIGAWKHVCAKGAHGPSSFPTGAPACWARVATSPVDSSCCTRLPTW